MTRRARLLVIGLISVVGGCASRPYTAGRATDVDPKLATPDYWWNQPAPARAGAADFQKLWDACESELHDRHFLVDREEYRQGLLSTEPLISAQAFEPWRTDTTTMHDRAESSLDMIRRTVRVEVNRRVDGTFEAVPKVLVERYATEGRRLTAINQFHEAFSGPHAFSDAPDLSGTSETATGAVYWYALRRDGSLERDMAAAITRRLHGRAGASGSAGS